MDPNLPRCSYPIKGQKMTILKENHGLYEVGMVNGTVGWTSRELWTKGSPFVEPLK